MSVPDEKGGTRLPRRYSASATPSSHAQPTDIELVNLASQLNTLELPSPSTQRRVDRMSALPANNRKRKHQHVRFDVPEEHEGEKPRSRKRRSSPCPVRKKKLIIRNLSSGLSDKADDLEERGKDTRFAAYKALSIIKHESTNPSKSPHEIENINQHLVDQNTNSNATNRAQKRPSVRRSKSDSGITSSPSKRKQVVVSKKTGIKKFRRSKDSASKSRKRKHPMKGQGDGCQKTSKRTKIISRKAVPRSENNNAKERLAGRKSRPKGNCITKRQLKRKPAVRPKPKRSRRVKMGKEVVRSRKKPDPTRLALRQFELKFSIEQLWKEFKVSKNKIEVKRYNKNLIKGKLTLKQMWKEYTQLRLKPRKKRKPKFIPIPRRGDQFEVGESLRIDLLKYLLCKKMDATSEKCCSKKCCRYWEEIDADYMVYEYDD